MRSFASVSKTCVADTGTPLPALVGFEGVAKIVLRAAPEEKLLMVGAFDGVSAMLGCVKVRAVALRCTVPGTT
jgi:hypothetical protein